MENVFDLLEKRGFVYQTSNEAGVRRLLGKPPATLYCGFDPSADSLHLGHLLVIMAMHHLQEAGHRVIYLIGGATGLVGDPTGKARARKRLTPEVVAANAERIKAQVEGMGLLRFHGKNAALMLNNYDWLGKFLFLSDFMMEIAPAFSVNEMVKMETFAQRLKEERHLSLLEFLYPAMQAWDFLHLFKQYDCRLQIGGQDQWGNILQGVDLIRRRHNEEAFALTFPLLTDPQTGVKMGKTEKGPVWLDPQRTPPFEMYQYIQGLPDGLVRKMLPLYTFLPMDEIGEIVKDPRAAQLRLAFEVTKIVHGEEAAQRARQDARRLFGREEGAAEAIPTFTLPRGGLQLDEVLTRSRALSSRSEVRRRCEGGAIRIGEKKVTDPKTLINSECIIRYGKGKFLKVEFPAD